jgi:uncharacterized protein YodC (DUF2158 family)
MRDQLAVKDVVALPSGGPTMTVQEIQGNEATCSYWDNGNFWTRTFPISVLKKLDS